VTKEAAEEEEREEDMKWMAALGKIEQKAATPRPLFLSLETGKTARQVPVCFFFSKFAR
jgi:hypothetical protein